MKKIISMKDVINIENFQKIQNDIAKATGVAIIATDYRGKPITKHSLCTEYCNIIRSDKNLKELCEKCDSRGGLEAARTGKPYIYRCHRGLVDFAIPIIIQDQYLGSLMSGQILTDNRDSLELEDIIQCNNSDEDNEMLIKAYEKLNAIPLKKIKAIANMMFHIANYIVEEGNFRIVQGEIIKSNDKIVKYNEDNIKLTRELNKLKLKDMESHTSENFIFEVLNTVASLSIIEGAHRTHEIICQLSKMLRYTLEKASKMVYLEEELKYIFFYLNLYKIRFGERLNFSIDIDSIYNNMKVPVMSIYLFIDNIILYVLKRNHGKLHIKISVEETENWIIILIKYNCIGINKNELLDINKKDILIDVKRRLDKFHMSEYDIEINSNSYKDTEIIIKLLRDR
ncbi:PocR ligand-binding domain-containing protein [Clostridium sp. K25]|uniref:PocR ligand-binding domain-containing protein n=1 Tax=Clostridium sp. K25 TaxID=1443109 RepID=UPI000A557C8D|nr:PocR ligand-binding domain-containing protein [Clostridium sp. K25]